MAAITLDFLVFCLICTNGTLGAILPVLYFFYKLDGLLPAAIKDYC
jgi:hypothetical protein